MRRYYFDFDAQRTHRIAGILTFERNAQHGSSWPPRRRGNLAGWLSDVLALVRIWHRRARERDQLAHLDLRMLRDIGVTPSEAARECDKPFWRG